jgi:hypothetical protein
MPPLTTLVTAMVLLAWGPALAAPANVSLKDPSPHATGMVDVVNGVKLEVLPWGGRGRPLVLLAGLPHIAHVFDDFAQRLARSHHGYGITRRASETAVLLRRATPATSSPMMTWPS